MSSTKKTRQEREQELQRLANTRDGLEIIVDLWKQARGVGPGAGAPGSIGTLVLGEMIPIILDHEYPNG